MKGVRPPLEHSFPTHEGLEIVSPENEDGSFFPKSDGKLYKSDDGEQPSFDYQGNNIIASGETTPIDNVIGGLETNKADENYFEKDVAKNITAFQKSADELREKYQFKNDVQKKFNLTDAKIEKKIKKYYICISKIFFYFPISTYIRFFDVNNGKCNFSMLAYLDSVTTLDIDPSGMILVSEIMIVLFVCWILYQLDNAFKRLYRIGKNLMRVYYVLNIIDLYHGWQGDCE
ncbi:WD40 repeat-like protein [Gigaspora margarita]|uniref:WD40 repeat-like protein n=1 Tax=Gigaspora margarita TaxID=4874 RepID=A0A8H3XIE0_GIGMA|nr:WD40 repeat-like protein [Gigaspora margarita]